MWTRGRLEFCLMLLACAATGTAISAQSIVNIDLEKPPFNYSETEDDNRVSRLIAKLKSGEIRLDVSSEHAYLKSMLTALEIPESSQTLVFSKTSMQVQHISRRNPRAIYFNDDTYVGWVRGSDIMEISTNDPKLGAAFYVADMSRQYVDVQRAYYDCLGCHATSMTQGIPGHTVRSVLPNVDGSVNTQNKSFISDHSSPFSDRWGGWYVTGQHGEMEHMGNAVLRDGRLDKRHSFNLLSLREEFNTWDYLLPYSDIVALMVLEHQSQTHNAMTRADFSVRQLLYDRGHREATTESEQELQTQLDLIAQQVTERMLFCDEAPLTSEVKGSVIFAGQFTRRGPQDRHGRSLREFEMKTRMFKYPCSYLIYSPAFDSLTDGLRSRVISQMLDVLQGRNDAAPYEHLTPTVRVAILEILCDTKPDFRHNAAQGVETSPHDERTASLEQSP